MDNILNVSILNNYIHNVFVAEELLHNIQVCGEISGLKNSNGNAFFTLKDDNAQINCVCFSIGKTYLPRDGESVVLRGSVDYYSKVGKINFSVTSIQPLGAGLLAIQFEKLKAMLLQKGYFDENHKKQIPTYCKNIGVITSTSGAVIKDIITTIRKVNKSININIFNVKVQGETSAKEIIEALGILDNLNYDAIIIARGGGSTEDLSSFNNEQLVYKIFDCKTPIISAVGHETDFTLCDLVADMRCPTPTASGQLIAYNEKELLQKIKQIRDGLNRKILRDIYISNNRIKEIKNQINFGFDKYYSKNLIKLELISNNLNNSYSNIVNNNKNILSQVLIKLNAYNPIAVMMRGFWRVEKENALVYKASELNVNDNITMFSTDGKIVAKVNEIIIGVKNEI